MRSWLRPSLRYGSVSTTPLARSVFATAAASTDVVEVDRADDERALGGVGRRTGCAKSDASAHAYRCPEDSRVRADAPVEPAVAEHPLDLVGEHEQRRHRRRVVGLVLARVVERRRDRRGTRGSSGRRPPAPRRARARRGSSARARARRRRRSTSAARSSRRRPASTSTGRPPAPDVASMRTSASPALAGSHDVDHHAGRRLVVRPGEDVGGSGPRPARARRRDRPSRRSGRRGTVLRR